MKILTIKHVITILLLGITSILTANDNTLFSYDSAKIDKQFEHLNYIENQIYNNKTSEFNSNIYYPINNNTIIIFTDASENLQIAPIPAFWITFVVAGIGTYTIYGAASGIVTVGIIWLASNKCPKTTKMAAWGCVAGMITGGLAKYLMMTLRSR